MKYKVNVNWTASVNKIVGVEADSREEALENVLRRCEEGIEYTGRELTEDSSGKILPLNPDSIEYFLEDELCEVVD